MTNTFGITARAYRFYADGTETGSTALANENTAYTANLVSGNINIQLRYGVQESGTGTASGASTDDYQLQYSTNGGGAWNDVTGASSVVKAYPSADLTDAAVTTSRLSAGTGSFVAGEIDEADGLVTDWQLTANNYSDLLYSITVVSADVATGASITFRVLRNGGTFNTYSVTPTIDVTRNVSAVVLTTTPTQPQAALLSDQSITAQVLTVTPTYPQAATNKDVTAQVLTVTPTLPQARVDLEAAAAVLTVTPTYPQSRLDHELVAQVLTVTPTLPAATITASSTDNRAFVTFVAFSVPLPSGGAQNVTAITLIVVPTYPQARIDHELIAQVLTASVSLPAARVDLDLTAVVLEATPSQPAARIDHDITAVVLTVTPTLPVATLTTADQMAATPLEVTPTYPAARLDHELTASVLVISPDLPAAEVGILIQSEPSGGYDRRLPPPRKRKPEKLLLPPLDWEIQAWAHRVIPVLPQAQVVYEPPVRKELPPDPHVMLMRELQILEREIEDMDALWQLL